jgi:hypothetical protein
VTVGLAVLVVALAGCLPSSQRENARDLSPADSASVRLAATAPVDTLDVVWTAQAPASEPMPIPTSLGWLGDRLAVVETQGGSVRVFTDDGVYAGRTRTGDETFPYFAGARGDTVVVLARGADRLLWVVPGVGVVRDVPAPPGATAALATDGLLAARVGGVEGPEPEVVLLDEGGAERGRRPVAGPAWRAVGFLRAWGGGLVALSGYRPVVDVLDPGAAPGAPLDTLALRGFDSPQLARSAQFMRGDVDEPPLLASSADPLGDRLFVLNLRGDHVRVDVYGRDGRLRRVLVSPGPWAPADAVPVDLAVRQRGGAVELAVLMARAPGLLRGPESRLALYRWRPPAA